MHTERKTPVLPMLLEFWRTLTLLTEGRQLANISEELTPAVHMQSFFWPVESHFSSRDPTEFSYSLSQHNFLEISSKC